MIKDYEVLHKWKSNKIFVKNNINIKLFNIQTFYEKSLSLRIFICQITILSRKIINWLIILNERNLILRKNLKEIKIFKKVDEKIIFKSKYFIIYRFFSLKFFQKNNKKGNDYFISLENFTFKDESTINENMKIFGNFLRKILNKINSN